MKARFMILTLRAWWELLCYDLINRAGGFQGIHRQLTRQRIASRKFDERAEAFCEAVSLAGCFYFRPVLCLQRSVAAARLMRRYGINGRVVIGYRTAPFFSHAWVEVDDHVVNDSPAYKERLQVLVTI